LQASVGCMATTSPRVDIQTDAPDLYRAYARLDSASGRSALDPALRLLVYLRASYVNGCAYCVESHTRDALAAGESDRRLYATAAWHESPLFSDRERAAFALTDALTHVADRGTDAAYEAAAGHFTPEELAALIYAIVTINGWNRLAISTHMVFDG
jgi:AhpD family alkylhydroperoxidase